MRLALFIFAIIAPSRAVAIRHTQYETTPVKDLMEGAQLDDRSAIIELGNRRERTAMKLLRKIAHEKDRAYGGGMPSPGHWRNESHLEARIALAKMGEGDFFDECVQNLSSPDGEKRRSSIKYLGEIGDKRAVKYLIPILDDQKAWRASRDLVRPACCEYAEAALGEILPEVGDKIHRTDSSEPTNFFISRWKDWWSRNHAAYENLK